ncbi:programmed cell death 1 ligand 1-like [Pseudophryne corroboree]|uniref:programmed cell death 1 ligand 1-like n=1 Tax=Pseudophryne corroboree TaxID=495146 RepID=UPI0030821408
MSGFLFLLLMLSDFHRVLALFIVTAPKLTYTARYGDRVQMTCKFPLSKKEDINELKVSWQYVSPKQSLPRQVIMFKNGKEDLLTQESTYKGRATLLLEELNNGQAILQIQDVKLSDAGTYLCALELGGSDFQNIKLDVTASFINIQDSVNISPEDNDVSLTCQSLGFPEAEVYWKKNGNNVSSPSYNTSHTRTVDGFYNTTSTIRGIDITQSYNCVFWNKATNEKTEASFQQSDLEDAIHRARESTSNVNTASQNNLGGNIPETKTIIIVLCMVVFLIVAITLVVRLRRHCFKCFRKKGGQSAIL